MNQSHPDDELHDLLETWKVSPAPHPRFVADVWRRIAVEEAADGMDWRSRLREWLFVQLPRPAYASAVLAATIVLTATAARLQASHARERYRIESARQYLAAIDPLAMADDPMHHPQ